MPRSLLGGPHAGARVLAIGVVHEVEHDGRTLGDDIVPIAVLAMHDALVLLEDAARHRRQVEDHIVHAHTRLGFSRFGAEGFQRADSAFSLSRTTCHSFSPQMYSRPMLFITPVCVRSRKSCPHLQKVDPGRAMAVGVG